MLSSLPQMLAKAYVLAAVSTCPAPPVTPAAAASYTLQPLQVSSAELQQGATANAEDSLWQLAFSFSRDMNVQFDKVTGQETNMTCYYIGNISTQVKVTPILKISSKYKPGSCEYNQLAQRGRERLTALKPTFDAVIPEMGTVLADAASGSQATEPMTDAAFPGYKANLSSALEAARQPIMTELTQALIDRNAQLAGEKDTGSVACQQ